MLVDQLAGVGRKKKTRRFLPWVIGSYNGVFSSQRKSRERADKLPSPNQIYRSALAICEPSAARTRRLSLAQRELALSLAQRLGKHHFGSPTSPPRPMVR